MSTRSRMTNGLPDFPKDRSHSREPRHAIPKFLSRTPRPLAQASLIGGAAVAGAALLGTAAR